MTYWALRMLGYGNLSNYGPSWYEWGGGPSGSNGRYPCTGSDEGCDLNGDNICTSSSIRK